jgi:hypothetical protein
MRSIDYKRFARLLARCEEIAKAEDADPSVALLYTDLLEAPATSFRAAHKVIKDAETAAGTENGNASVSLDAFDGHYRAARAISLAYVPALAVPETLKRQPTDTDKKEAIKDLLGMVNKHAGSKWAEMLLEGNFGKLAPTVIDGLGDADGAATDLAKARTARAKAYGPAYVQYMAFKKVVREIHGEHSREYRRIHLRSTPSAELESDEPPASPEDKPSEDEGVASGI